MHPPVRAADARPRRRRRATKADWARVVIPIFILAGLVVAAWQFGYFDLEKPDALHQAAHRVRGTPWLPLAFAAVYATLATLAAPVSPLAYGAGAVFGVVEGSILVWVASMIGGAAGYAMARTIWAESARRLLGRHEDKLRMLSEGGPFLTTLRLQLMPVVPFGLFNYAAGTAKLTFFPFWLASGLAILPSTLAAVYVGDRLRAGVRGSGATAFAVAAAVMLAMFVLSLVPTLFAKRRKRRELTREVPPSGRHGSLAARARGTRQPQR
jgi:uncharacterized membrane protein YdjX (TVP38/TMEM64 family)